MQYVTILLSLLKSPFADVLLPIIAEKIGIPVELLRTFLDWLSKLAPAEQAAVGVAIEPAFSAVSSAADVGCDLPDCPDCDKDKVIEALAAYAKAA